VPVRFWYGSLKEKPLRKPRYRRKDNIKMDLQEVGWGGLNWIDLAQDRERCKWGNKLSGSIKCKVFID
jgi:hypothetical protein